MGLSCTRLFAPLGLDYFLFHIGEIFNYNLFKNFLIPYFFSSASGTPIIQMLLHLIWSQMSPSLSSVLFILFPLFCSSKIISTVLSSSSLICFSASDILLLIPSSSVQFSSVAQSCLTLCDPMDCSLLGSSVHGIFQARILEWAAISRRNR